MNKEEFAALLKKCMAELRLKSEAHVAGWGFGKFARWDLDQEDGKLVFSDPKRPTATAPAQIIGSWSAAQGTWLWGWANPSVDDRLKQDALKVRAFGEENRLQALTRPERECSEADAWRMTALAVHLCESQGAYRGPAGSTFVFISFGDVRLVKPEGGESA